MSLIAANCDKVCCEADTITLVGYLKNFLFLYFHIYGNVFLFFELNVILRLHCLLVSGTYQLTADNGIETLCGAYPHKENLLHYRSIVINDIFTGLQ